MAGKLAAQIRRMIDAVRAGQTALLFDPAFVVMSRTYWDQHIAGTHLKVNADLLEGCKLLEEFATSSSTLARDFRALLERSFYEADDEAPYDSRLYDATSMISKAIRGTVEKEPPSACTKRG